MVVAVRFYCEGQKVVMPVTVISVIAVGFKVLFNFMFMFGNFGAQALGVTGCGLATFCGYAAFLLMLVGYVSLAPCFAGGRLFASLQRPDFPSIVAILKKGVPIGLCFTSEFLTFSIMTLFISRGGAVAAAAHQVAFNCMVVFFSMAAAFSSAACIRVGNLFGSGDKEMLRRSVAGIVSLSGLIGCLLMAGMVFKAEAWLRSLPPTPSSSRWPCPSCMSPRFSKLLIRYRSASTACCAASVMSRSPSCTRRRRIGLLAFRLAMSFRGCRSPLAGASGAFRGCRVVLAFTVALFLATAALGLRARMILWGKAGRWRRLSRHKARPDAWQGDLLRGGHGRSQ